MVIFQTASPHCPNLKELLKEILKSFNNGNISDTISPLSEQSLSSPVEDTGGYQSEVTSSVFLFLYFHFYIFWILIRGNFLLLVLLAVYYSSQICGFRNLAGPKMVSWGRDPAEERCNSTFTFTKRNDQITYRH